LYEDYKLERIWKESAIASLKVLSWHLSGGIEVKNKKSIRTWDVVFWV
jgi:hypothetical protein